MTDEANDRAGKPKKGGEMNWWIIALFIAAVIGICIGLAGSWYVAEFISRGRVSENDYQISIPISSEPRSRPIAFRRVGWSR
jgi:hypothetical protein